MPEPDPKMVGFYVEFHFDRPMTEWMDKGEACIPELLANMRGPDGMQFPVEKDGVMHGFMRPKGVQIQDDGKTMRIEFDTDDVSLPVYREVRNPDGGG